VSYRVDKLANKSKKPYKSLAIGSAEGFGQAEKAIQANVKAGTWILLKNVHLAPQWLVHLKKKLHSLEAKPSFCLFLTSEVHPALPGALLWFALPPSFCLFLTSEVHPALPGALLWFALPPSFPL